MKIIKASVIALSIAPFIASAAPVFDGATLDRDLNSVEKINVQTNTQSSFKGSDKGGALNDNTWIKAKDNDVAQISTLAQSKGKLEADVNLSPNDKSAQGAKRGADDSSKSITPQIAQKGSHDADTAALTVDDADDEENVFTQTSKMSIPQQAQAAALEKQRSIAQLLGLDIGGEKKSDEELKKDYEELKKVLKHATPLPVKNLMAIEANGKMLFISDNQRYIFEGKLYDMYNSLRELKTVEDIEKIGMRIDYKELGVDPDTLNSARIGNGPENVVIYCDPLGAITRELMEKALSFPNKENYSFFFVVTASMDAKSQDLAKRFYCARESGNMQAGNLLYSGQLDTLPLTDCDMQNYARSNMVAHFTGVDVSPFIVAPDGAMSRGVPLDGFENWILEHSEHKIEDNRLKSPEVTRMIETNVTQRALVQDFAKKHNVSEDEIETESSLEQQLHNDLQKQQESATTSQSQSTADDMPLSAIEDDIDTTGLDDKYVRQVKKARDRYIKNLERIEVRKEAASRRYNDSIERIKAAYANIEKYPGEKKQRRAAELAQSAKRAEADYKEDLDKISKTIQEAHKDYKDKITQIKKKVERIKSGSK